MSLLHRGTETVAVFPEETVTDADGNTITRASATGVVCKAVVQPMPRSDNTEEQDGGFMSETKLRLRLVGWAGGLLGPQSKVEWQGDKYSIHGEPRQFNGSRRTKHVDYFLTRS